MQIGNYKKLVSFTDVSDLPNPDAFAKHFLYRAYKLGARLKRTSNKFLPFTLINVPDTINEPAIRVLLGAAKHLGEKLIDSPMLIR